MYVSSRLSIFSINGYVYAASGFRFVLFISFSNRCVLYFSVILFLINDVELFFLYVLIRYSSVFLREVSVQILYYFF